LSADLFDRTEDIADFVRCTAHVLFRQAESRDWSGVLDRISIELGALIDDWRHRAMPT
jgi:hypothetical protein